MKKTEQEKRKRSNKSRFNNKSLIEKREIRFFISSTFQDMEVERSAIVKVFNELKIIASRRNVILSMVDLRWGVTEEESRTGKVLSVCLSEIEHSHPFFIGLLGSRYGSSPNKNELEKNKDLEERYPWIRKDIENELSITEIEIQYGVLRNPNKVDAAFFINKVPNCLPDNSEKLTNLKKNIKDHKSSTCDDYYSIEDLCQKIKRRVTNIIDKYFIISYNSKLDQERAAQYAFINTYHAHYIKNSYNHRIIDNFVHGNDSYLVISGPSGMGKSALIANWIKENYDKSPYRIIYYFLGNSTTSNDYYQILSYIRDNIYDLYQIERNDYRKESLEEETQRIMNEATEKNNPLLIIIDGINQIVEHDNAKLLNWLPTTSNNKVKYLFSTIKDDETWDTFKFRNYPICNIKPLNKKQRYNFTKQYLGFVGKKLEKEQIDKIISDPESKNTLILKTLLDELICFGSYKKLNKRIKYYLSASSVNDFFNRMLKRMEADYSLDKDIVRHVLSLIALSENGLSDEEILQITGIRQIDWYLFYCAFYNHFVKKQGLISFSHQYILETVQRRYKIKKDQTQESYRKEIVNYFTSSEVGISDSDRQISELSFQYYNLKDCDRLYNIILNYNAFNFFCNTNLNPLANYWRMLMTDNPKKYSLQNYLQLPCINIDAIKMPLLNVGLFVDLYFADYYLAIKYYQANIQNTINVLGPNHSHIGAAYNNIGDDYARLSESELALKYYKKALTIAENTIGTNHPNTANVYNNIGAIFADMGDYKTALDYHQKALDVHLNVLGENHSCVATDYNNISMVYYEQGAYDKAEEFCEKAYSISVAIQGTEHPDTAFYLSNLGEICNQKGEGKKAMAHYVKALAIGKIFYGDIHPEIASIYNSIGLLYYGQRKFKFAYLFFSTAKKIYEQTLGKDHLDTAATYNNLGLFFYSQKKYDKAYKYYTMALNIRKKKLTKNHPEIAFSYNNIGVLYFSQKFYSKALDNYFKCLYIRELQLGLDHVETAQTYHNIGDVYFALKDCRKSLRFYLKALASREKILGMEHQDTGATSEMIGIIYDHAKKYIEALQYYSKAIISFEKTNHSKMNEIYERIKAIKTILSSK